MFRIRTITRADHRFINTSLFIRIPTLVTTRFDEGENKPSKIGRTSVVNFCYRLGIPVHECIFLLFDSFNEQSGRKFMKIFMGDVRSDSSIEFNYNNLNISTAAVR